MTTCRPVHQLRPRELSPQEEAKRLAAIRRYDILDTPPDGSFDRITAIAARLFSVPISIISLVDHDRIWFKSHHGLDVRQIEREPGLCASAILQNAAWVLTDAKTDVRSLANPLVAGEFGLRFYVGIPLRTHDGFNLGTLCVIDRAPRSVSNEQIAHLTDLASTVMDQMELRLAARRAIADLSQVIDEKAAALRRAELMAKEIDHRVMNSLQLVSGLLNIQSRATDNSEVAEQLTLASTRISAVARAHRNIYRNKTVGRANGQDYLERLCSDLSDMLGLNGRERIVVDAVDAELPTEQIVPLGLIVNELVTNAAKHGAGNITVKLEDATSKGYILSVSDQGTSLPADFDPARTRGLGMKVIGALAQQLGGELRFDGNETTGETRFAVLFGRQSARSLSDARNSNSLSSSPGGAA
ncbi:MAG TPA: histidine kinase dimerization/phosphoacceptor domain -containing protein [Bradyrhizobium sp.]|uniref:histidine kinase dimerization/phosphoacceptor domain -containing protein n=1 Tax=Bradyrhizobium sp. TaxID=376 RepID=UPI002B89F6C6|nr:histidine kinase dimerization/phosphoacceptor domain -containing protein [Bradyrhizobium sp.]HLZ01692.1 histidine kinase dimerization/phosphoacceptor domain -containing protein [Bradyrhizobium sp.]